MKLTLSDGCITLQTSRSDRVTNLNFAGLIRLEDGIRDRLDQLATAMHRSKSFLAAQAIEAFVESNEWQVGEIQAALKEVDVGDYASEQDVADMALKWQVRAQ